MRISDWSSDVCSSDLRMITSPGRGVLKAVNVAAQTFLRTVSRVVGAEVIDDAVAFFQAFEGREEGFRERDRKSVVSGKSVSVRVDLGGRRSSKKPKYKTPHRIC